MKSVRVLLCLVVGLLATISVRAAGPEAQLETLKAKFPEARTQQVKVTKSKTKIETFEVKVPPADVWAKYHGPVASATLATLPAVIARLESASKGDSTVLRNQQKTLVGTGAKEQADATLGWLNGPLAGYLAKLKALVPPPK